MAEPKPFASLSSGLLARKGSAMPAMRRQMMGLINSGSAASAAAPNLHGHDDLGWNDMGDDAPHHSDPLSVVGLTPMPHHHSAPVPPIVEQAEMPVEDAGEAAAAPRDQEPQDEAVPAVVEQRRMLAERVETPAEVAAVRPAPARTSRTAVRTSKAAFTLRLDPDRHLRLRLACAVDNRSAQQLVTEALDAYLSSQPQIEALADQLPRPDGAKL